MGNKNENNLEMKNAEIVGVSKADLEQQEAEDLGFEKKYQELRDARFGNLRNALQHMSVRNGDIQRSATEAKNLVRGKGDLHDAPEGDLNGKNIKNIKLGWFPLFRYKLNRAHALHQTVENCKKMRKRAKEEMKSVEKKLNFYQTLGENTEWYRVGTHLGNTWNKFWTGLELSRAESFDNSLESVQSDYAERLSKYQEKAKEKAQKHTNIVKSGESLANNYAENVVNLLQSSYDLDLKNDKEKLADIFLNKRVSEPIKINDELISNWEDLEKYLESQEGESRTRSAALKEIRKLKGSKTLKVATKHVAKHQLEVDKYNEYKTEKIEARRAAKRTLRVFSDKIKNNPNFKDGDEVSFEIGDNTNAKKLFENKKFVMNSTPKGEIYFEDKENKKKIGIDVERNVIFTTERNGKMFRMKELSDLESAAIIQSITKIKKTASSPDVSVAPKKADKPEKTEEIIEAEEADSDAKIDVDLSEIEAEEVKNPVEKNQKTEEVKKIKKEIKAKESDLRKIENKITEAKKKGGVTKKDKNQISSFEGQKRSAEKKLKKLRQELNKFNSK